MFKGEGFLPILFLLFPVFTLSGYDKNPGDLEFNGSPPQELLVFRDSQVLYNGKVWYKRYTNVRGNEFFSTALWVSGEVAINGRTFRVRSLRYDIANDELLIRRSDGVAIAMNGEMISGFTLYTDGNEYHFKNFRDNDNYGMSGYSMNLYEGKTALLLKPVKELIPLGYQKIMDMFVQTDFLYVYKNGQIHRIRYRKDLLDLLDDKRNEVRNFIRTSRLDIFPKQPGSIIPVLRYYDSLPE
jgi:hypothetical protein